MAVCLTFHARAEHPDNGTVRRGWINPALARVLHTAEDDDLPLEIRFGTRAGAVDYIRDFMGPEYTETDNGVYTVFETVAPEYYPMTGERFTYTAYMETD